MEIGQKLKDKRTGLGLSQEQLAEQLGVTRQTIANWEKGKTYPDIGSVLKLSDLYSVSLDELLKEDRSMRKHVEESAELPRKYWNMLFELAILLNPFGALVAHWGAEWLGVTMAILGLLMLPPLWVARHRMFGMSKEDMKHSITGWCMHVGAMILILITDNLTVELAAHILQLIGILKIWSHGIYLERGTRFWLVIFLYLGIPAYIFGSAFLGQLNDAGAFVEAQPFGHDYRIAAVEHRRRCPSLSWTTGTQSPSAVNGSGASLSMRSLPPIRRTASRASGIWCRRRDRRIPSPSPASCTGWRSLPMIRFC